VAGGYEFRATRFRGAVGEEKLEIGPAESVAMATSCESQYPPSAVSDVSV
jgi:hypothetical protein